MKLSLCHVAIFVLVSVAVVPTNCGQNRKIKIIVPHKINFVHYHHHPNPRSRISDEMKQHYLEQLRNQDEDESDEYVDASDDSYDVQEEESEGSRRGGAYHMMPMYRFSHSAAVKPVVSYNGPYNKFKYPTTYTVVRYGDYPESERRHSERRPTVYFDYK